LVRLDNSELLVIALLIGLWFEKQIFLNLKSEVEMTHSKKNGLIIFTGFVLAKVLSRIALGLFSRTGLIPPLFIIIPSLLIFVCYVVYSIRWTKRETDFTKIHKSNIAILCGAIALDLITFGWEKIFHLQFNVPLGMLDLPFNEIDDVSLMWAFFGRSFPFIVTIGVLEMVGSLFLLFSKTRTLGIFTLLPIMITILSFDIFYHLDFGVISHAVILILALFYLLFQDFEKIRDFFFSKDWNTAHLLSTSPVIKTTIRFIIIFLPLFLILLRLPRDKNPQLTGKYQVQKLEINGIDKKAKSVYDSTLTRVYFDVANDIVFDFNTTNTRFIGTYELNEDKIFAKWRYPRNDIPTFTGTVKIEENRRILSGVMGKDTLVIALER
jgi:hypothetical protein